MNISNNSECSSGCESGWTMYWDQLSNSNTQYPYTTDFAQQDQEEELSTVSDASSAPPHLLENYSSQVSEADKKKSKKKILMSKTKETKGNNKKQQHSFCLDDTATSSIFHFSQDNVAHQHSSVEHVPGFSSQQDEPKPKNHLGFFKSSSKGKSGSLVGRKRQ